MQTVFRLLGLRTQLLDLQLRRFKLGFDCRKFPIPLLEDLIRATQHIQMKLLVLRMLVHASREIAHLPLVGIDFLARLLNAFAHRIDPYLGHVGLIRHLLLGAPQIEHRLLGILNLLDQRLPVLLVDDQARFLLLQVLLQLVDFALQRPRALVDLA